MPYKYLASSWHTRTSCSGNKYCTPSTLKQITSINNKNLRVTRQHRDDLNKLRSNVQRAECCSPHTDRMLTVACMFAKYWQQPDCGLHVCHTDCGVFGPLQLARVHHVWHVRTAACFLASVAHTPQNTSNCHEHYPVKYVMLRNIPTLCTANLVMYFEPSAEPNSTTLT